ncbi:MAG: peptidylprolyl isomerase [Parcubacteria group bacterium]|jgi:parvulin-like peptidyl-prolyl isomerase
MSKQKKEEKRIKIQTIIKAFLILLIAYIVSTGAFLYFFPETENRIVRATASIIPYPSVISNSVFITTERLQNQLAGAKKFYEGQDFSQIGMRVDFGTEDGKKRLLIKEKNILNKLIDDAIIEKEAKKKSIIISQDLIDQEVDRKMKEYGTGDYLKNNLEKLYGWNVNDFKKNIVKPDLYQEKVFADMRKSDASLEEARKKINQAKNDISGGMSFSDAAKKYSQGESAKNGGALGWFSANQMLPEVASVIFNLEKNKQSDIIESAIGFHIILVEDKKNQDGQDMMKISQIFVPTKTFAQWLSETKKDYRIFIPIRKFIWNNETGEVEFRDKSLREYENDLLENPINDPSIIF